MQPILLSALAPAWLVAAPASGQENWVPFASKQARFSIDMPTQPKATTSTTSSFIGNAGESEADAQRFLASVRFE